ncbi:Uncharacterized protein OBRU01_17109 [Operophtera brumata]|uniref:Sodium-dependent phosphate transporter n=1 Tax=Operophtera brumata TaxID=104452 RepID=A0A0L7L1E7_OPEBR|nr:Uncharacterized protein OBRU01_17109 [Operophtera brumata]
MGGNYGVQAQAHQLLGQKTEMTRKYDNALTRTLRSCKYDNALTRTLQSCCFIPQRYILGVMGLLGVCNAFTMRVCLNLAITQMVKRNKTDGTYHDDPYACPSDEIVGNVSSSTIENPGALVFGGAQIGNIFGSFMSGILLSEGRDWAYVFYFFGGFGIFWFILWSLFVYSTPNTHPFISKKELSYLNHNVTTADSSSKKDAVPWKAILRSAPAWALVWASINALDLAPNYAGSLTSLVNTISTLAGIITPYLIGLLTPDSTLAQWRVAFWVCFVVSVGTNIIYIIWADGKQQWWDDVRQYGYPECWKHGPLVNESNPEQPENVVLSDHNKLEELN